MIIRTIVSINTLSGDPVTAESNGEVPTAADIKPGDWLVQQDSRGYQQVTEGL